jgi:kynurenine 3-monooxygenase
VGDACHAQLPFYGQGMNSAFEDCCLLMSALKKHNKNKSVAFQLFESSRRIHTNALGQLSKDNFVELRQKVRSPWFMARKKLDLAISKLCPTAWQPLYSMIAHSTMPYGEAMLKARRQDRILNVIGTCTLLGVTLFAGFMFKGSI